MTAPGPSRVLVVRHGATEWSKLGRHTGRTDLDLDADGVDEARRLVPLLDAQLAGSRPLVLSSPMRRCLHTAAVLLPHEEVTVVDGLREVDYGRYEGRTAADIQAERPGWNVFVDGSPDGEGLPQVIARCDAVIAKVERMAVDRVVVVITHGHLGRVLVARLIGLPGEAAAALHHDTGSLAVIDRRRDRLVLSGWNRRPT